MNKWNSYEDEKVDGLIRKVLKEEAEKISVPDRIKEEVFKKIGKKKSASKN